MGKNKGHVPTRTCITCRRRREKKDLIKLILDDQARLVLGENGKGKGRGAYVCPQRTCWEGLKKRKDLSKIFRMNGVMAFHPEFQFKVE